MEEAIKEFQIEVRGGNVSATEWMPLEFAYSLEEAKKTRAHWVSMGHEARILTREISPWRVLDDGGDK